VRIAYWIVVALLGLLYLYAGWWPADSSVCAVGARVAGVEWWRGYRGCTA
jgi:hypothetical protein